MRRMAFTCLGLAVLAAAPAGSNTQPQADKLGRDGTPPDAIKLPEPWAESEGDSAEDMRSAMPELFQEAEDLPLLNKNVSVKFESIRDGVIHGLVIEQLDKGPFSPLIRVEAAEARLCGFDFAKFAVVVVMRKSHVTFSRHLTEFKSTGKLTMRFRLAFHFIDPAVRQAAVNRELEKRRAASEGGNGVAVAGQGDVVGALESLFGGFLDRIRDIPLADKNVSVRFEKFHNGVFHGLVIDERDANGETEILVNIGEAELVGFNFSNLSLTANVRDLKATFMGSGCRFYCEDRTMELSLFSFEKK